MQETFEKVNDYTIQSTLKEDATDGRGNGYVYMSSRIVRIFNFAAGTITSLHHNRTFRSEQSTPAVVSEQTTVEKFKDMPSLIEVEIMREKLVGMGGHPPLIEDVLSGRRKRELPKTSDLNG